MQIIPIGARYIPDSFLGQPCPSKFLLTFFDINAVYSSDSDSLSVSFDTNVVNELPDVGEDMSSLFTMIASLTCIL